MTLQAKFFVLSVTRAISKKTNEPIMYVDLFIAGVITSVYVSSANMAMFADVKPETHIEIEFRFKNAYQSKDLQIDPVNVVTK
jgi:hypothetical protein